MYKSSMAYSKTIILMLFERFPKVKLNSSLRSKVWEKHGEYHSFPTENGFIFQ